MKQLFFTILIILALLACSEDNALTVDVPSFSKLYYATDYIEANDFIEKDDGYLILATYFNSDRSGMYLINTDAEGYISDTIRIISDSAVFYERGITLKRYENEVYILGIRSTSAFDPDNVSFTSFVFKTDLNGLPINSGSVGGPVNISEKLLSNEGNFSMKMNDFIIKDGRIVFGGTVYNNGNTGEIVQVYDLQEFELSEQPVPQEEFPNQLQIDEKNTTVQRVFAGNNTGIKFTTIGQNTISNDVNSTAPASRNIVRKSYPLYNSPAPYVPRIYSPNEENLGDALQESIGGTFYYAGSYGTPGNTGLTTDLFVIRDDFNPVIGAGQQEFTEETYTDIVNEKGNFVVSLAQNSLGNIYVATTTRINNVNIGPSHLFKLSAAGSLLKADPIEFVSSRFYNIKKIKVSQKDDKILVLSSIEFENNARAVGLMKLNF